MSTHSSILAWRIPWMKEAGGLQSWAHKELNTTERVTERALTGVTELRTSVVGRVFSAMLFAKTFCR